MAEPQLDRPYHELRRNATAKRPGRILLWSTQAAISTPEPGFQFHTFGVGCGALCEYVESKGLRELEWRNFYDPSALWSWVEALCEDDETLWMVSHRLGYHMRAAEGFSRLPRRGFRPSFFTPAESCLLIEWRRGRARLRCYDNLNWFQCAMSDLRAGLGLPPRDVDLAMVADAQLLTYCRQDVATLVVTWRKFLRLMDSEGFGDLGPSRASVAFSAYRHGFMPPKLGIHSGAESCALARESYRGGRCEVFYVGRPPPGEYYLLDARALYPAMMRFYQYPKRRIKIVRRASTAYLAHLLKTNLAIAEVCLDTPEPVFPHRIGKRTCFPTGQFFSVLTTQELEIALAFGWIKAIGRVVLYEPADLFSKWVDHTHALREQYRVAGDRVFAGLLKGMGSTLAAKFGARGYHQSILGDAPIDEVGIRRYTDLPTGETWIDYIFGGRAIRQTRQGESFNSFPAIPAHVNANGRLWMWSLMRQAGRRNVLYTDTDSLIVNQAGFDRLQGEIKEGQLGALKVEGVSRSVEIRAKKDYTLGGREIRKGIRQEATEIAPGVFEQWHFTSTLWGLETGSLDGVAVFEAHRRLRYNLVAGAVGDSGWVRPPHLSVSLREIASRLSDNKRQHKRAWWWDREWLRQVVDQDGRRRSLGRARDHLARTMPEFATETPTRLRGASTQGRP